MVSRSSRVRRRRRRAGVAMVAFAAVAVALAVRSLDSPALTVPSPTTDAPEAPAGQPPRDEQRDALGEAGGAVRRGTTVFDDDIPGVANLDPDLLDALRRAATDADVRFVVDSGWRSRAYQAELLREAVEQYGSEEEAARWVATPDTSAHVSGDAVDLGKKPAAWLADRGAAYGLCRIYDNEPWHYELRPDAATEGCPPTYADASHDPRLQR